MQRFIGRVSGNVYGFYFLPTAGGVSWLVFVQKWVSPSPFPCLCLPGGALGVVLVLPRQPQTLWGCQVQVLFPWSEHQGG